MVIRIAAVGDVHLDEDVVGRFRPALDELPEHADVLLLAGDLTRHGTESEARCVATEFGGLGVPVVTVLGNHDHQCDQVPQVVKVLEDVGITVLEGNGIVLECAGGRLGVAGVKGFGGGFGNATLQAFGEGQTKSFVQEAVHESLKLEAALSHLDTPKKVVIMHYAPVPDTLEGENIEIRPFLGTSRLSMPVDHYGAEAVFHGHAHHGAPSGKTKSGIPVYNVAMPLMTKLHPEQRFMLLEV
jgi:Icc-related predicted phosphoesterase